MTYKDFGRINGIDGFYKRFVFCEGKKEHYYVLFADFGKYINMSSQYLDEGFYD